MDALTWILIGGATLAWLAVAFTFWAIRKVGADADGEIDDA